MNKQLDRKREAEANQNIEIRNLQNKISSMEAANMTLNQKIRDLEDEIESNGAANKNAMAESQDLIKNVQAINARNLAQHQKKILELMEQNEQLEKGLCLYIPHKFDRIDIALANFLN